MSVHLILGGARSGKSRYAEALAQQKGLPVTYLATAQVYDDDFAERVKQHQLKRPTDWKLVESPFYLAKTMLEHANPNRCLIVDCLTLWLAQCICDDCEMPEGVSWVQEKSHFLSTLNDLPGEVILVSNEVGMGIVPLGEINRRFQDEQGRLNQAVASYAQHVTFVAAGLPITLKGNK